MLTASSGSKNGETVAPVPMDAPDLRLLMLRSSQLVLI
jgi:hypothetical protein